ncbi:MAG: hypothetical protein EOM36_04425 [Bacteroidia bacterium]|nr:hypothetical protein [Bacteroidia bacterium]
MIVSFTPTDYYLDNTDIEQEAKDNNGIFVRESLQKHHLRGLPADTLVYLKVDRSPKEAMRLIFQFPKLHFNLYGEAKLIRYTKLRTYIYNNYPELFI